MGAHMTDARHETRLMSVEDTLSWIVASEGFNLAAIYRGQTYNWPLLPSLFRNNELARRLKGFQNLERRVLNAFKARAHPFLASASLSEFDWMVLAQHHGCPTRLLDWTTNPLVALFFATESDDDNDAVIWSSLNFRWYAQDLPDTHLQNQDRTFVYFAKHINPRISAQAGSFTVHPFSNQKGKENPIPMEDEKNKRNTKLTNAIIPADCKRLIRRQLDRLNVNRASLFPGLDGISDHIKASLARELE
jgi:hypothetical protein